MTEDVVIKGYPHGIRLMMNSDIPIEQLLTSICVKFADAKSFFGRATMTLSLENRDLSDEETEAVIQCIERNSDVRISVVSSKERIFEKQMAKKKEAFFFAKASDYLKIYNGDVKSGEKAISAYGLLITGNIEEGAAAECGGSLVVLGNICGRASAGREISRKAYIIAAGIEEADVSIGSVSENFSIKKKKKLLSDKNEMIIVTAENGALSASQFTGQVNV